MNDIAFKNEKLELFFDGEKGSIVKLNLFDGFKMNCLLYEELKICSLRGLKKSRLNIQCENENLIKAELYLEYRKHKLIADLEIYKSGYIICTFEIETLLDNNLVNLLVGVPLSKEAVFSKQYQIKHIDENDKRKYVRATSILFSTDDRPITNSVDFILESVNDGKKICIDSEKGKFIGWEITASEFSKKGEKYRNRWCIHTSKIDNSPSKVRGQRIYHWYGFYPNLPSMDMIDEIAEYGCSILILHMPSLKWIDGSVPINGKAFKAVISKAHLLGIKMMFYIQPLLISKISPMHSELIAALNDNGKLCWHSLKDTQIVFYVPNSDYDCDELCLRCEEAYDYVKNSVLDCYKKYGFDGLYIDFAWPSIAVCTNETHKHKEGLFNFYDYLRMMREFREEIGPESIMVGHGGSLLVSSDYAEGFDACLTGEGQKDMLPDVIGVQTGTVPTLWTMHRRKEKQFRSKDAMNSIIREGITPHIGLGILGKSIRASLDPAHTPHFIALWQMWRAFPMHKAEFYNYLTTDAVTIENVEITYSLYKTPEQQVLLTISHGGGPKAEAAVSVEADISLDIEKLQLPETMNSWVLKGNTYETFRIYESRKIKNGQINIPEIAINEFIGIILTQGSAPKELTELKEHLKGRFDRLPLIYKNRMQRLKETDRMIADFNKLDLKAMSEEEFMKDRTME